MMKFVRLWENNLPFFTFFWCAGFHLCPAAPHNSKVYQYSENLIYLHLNRVSNVCHILKSPKQLLSIISMNNQNWRPLDAVDVYATLCDKYCLTACRCFPIICVCIVYVIYFFPFPIATHLTCEAKTAWIAYIFPKLQCIIYICMV